MKTIDVDDGRALKVQFAIPGKGQSAYAAYTELDRASRASVLLTMQKLAAVGRVLNRERFKPVEKTDFFEVKKHRHRFVGFFLPDQRFVVAAYEAKKKSGKLRPGTLQRARRIRDEMLRELREASDEREHASRV